MRYVHAIDGNVAATIDSTGRVSLGHEPGPIIGLVRASDVYADEAGADLIGHVEPEGRIVDAEHNFVGSVDVHGRVTDRSGRVVGRADRPVDGVVLLLLVGRVAPAVLASPNPSPAPTETIMDETLALAEESASPGVRKNYKPLSDEDVLGVPHKKKK